MSDLFYNAKKWKNFLSENKKYPVEECGGDMPPLPPMPAEVPIPPTGTEDPMTLAAELGSLGLDPAMAQSVVDLLISKGLLGGVAGPVDSSTFSDPTHPVVPSSMMEAGYKGWDSTSELERAMSGMSKESFMQVLKDVQKQLGLSDEEMAQRVMKFVNSGTGMFQEGRYKRSQYQGDDPRAQAFDQAITILDDQVYDSLEDDVASYADDAVRALSKAIDELEYKRNQVGNTMQEGALEDHVKQAVIRKLRENKKK